MQLTLFDDATDCRRSCPMGKRPRSPLNTRQRLLDVFLAALLGESKELISTGSRWTGAGIVRSDECEIAWRILDAQYFGVPQRRRRVFLVAGNRDRRVAQILLSNQAKAGILNRAEKRGKNLPPLLKAALEHIENPTLAAQ